MRFSIDDSQILMNFLLWIFAFIFLPAFYQKPSQPSPSFSQDDSLFVCGAVYCHLQLHNLYKFVDTVIWSRSCVIWKFSIRDWSRFIHTKVDWFWQRLFIPILWYYHRWCRFLSFFCVGIVPVKTSWIPLTLLQMIWDWCFWRKIFHLSSLEIPWFF